MVNVPVEVLDNCEYRGNDIKEVDRSPRAQLVSKEEKTG